ncbi:acyl-CoA thioesterase [Mariniblastus fucicola]|uniref:1,4-dihydroxy-2-naphthoyl-CoA hydrolase n=1 Tax=Mariniblastus fucicola TaxID=980251 RepID=A0A5B9PDR6_9BACT|nr:acyl-CoA thioesterase [Mariniblastus fucicola]QEG24548.1 1,4-dihydroxy-2-naphthoyl-CoA hydrolase [Mariniblastus fucicola]
MPSSSSDHSSAINRFEISKTVRWVDTDASGMVHTSALIRMMEETEYAFLRSRELSVVLTDGRGLMGFPRLSAEIEVQNFVGFDTEVTVELFLMLVDGKSIRYEFRISTEHEPVATGAFRVAVCRFPAGELPYAILTPEYVIELLTKPGVRTLV